MGVWLYDSTDASYVISLGVKTYHKLCCCLVVVVVVVVVVVAVAVAVAVVVVVVVVVVLVFLNLLSLNAPCVILSLRNSLSFIANRFAGCAVLL